MILIISLSTALWILTEAREGDASRAGSKRGRGKVFGGAAGLRDGRRGGLLWVKGGRHVSVGTGRAGCEVKVKAGVSGGEIESRWMFGLMSSMVSRKATPRRPTRMLFDRRDALYLEICLDCARKASRKRFSISRLQLASAWR